MIMCILLSVFKGRGGGVTLNTDALRSKPWSESFETPAEKTCMVVDENLPYLFQGFIYIFIVNTKAYALQYKL